MSDSTSDLPKRTPSDEELMAAVAQRDLGAFEHLVLRHQNAAWSAAYRFVGDEAEAEDIAQEAFLRILQAAPRYVPSARFRTYLYRIVTRLCIDHSEKMRPVYSDELPEPVDSRPAAIDLLTTVERVSHVRSALAQLPAKQRIAVILKYYEGLGYSEIALCLESTPKAVERLLARARSALFERLDHLR